MISFFNKQKNKNERGFTLIEALVTIIVISIGVLSAINLINNSFGLATIAKNKLIAADLAQEGFELVRNVRDVNYLNDRDWLYGLDNCLDPFWCRIDSSLSSPLAVQISSADLYQGQVCLSSNNNNYYSINCTTSSADVVKFRRLVQITPIGSLSGGAKVISRVSWQEKGVWKDFGTSGGNFEYHLCNWKSPNLGASVLCY